MLFPLLLHPIFFKNQKASETTKGSRMKFFRPVRQKVFEKSVILRPMQQNILYQFFLKAERFPYQFSRCYQTQKNFRQNCDVTTPRPRSPMHDKFRHQKFFEMQMCSPTRLIVSVKKSSTVNGAILLWCIKISIAKFFWNTERLNGYKTKFIGTMRHKKKSEKPVMLPRPSMRENFRCKIFLESEKGSHTIFYGTTGQKTFDRKSWYPHIMHEFYSIPQNFWNTEVFSNVFFYYCETKIFDKTVIPSPSYPWEFSISIFFEIPVCSLTNFFGNVILFVFDGKLR